MHTTYSSHTNYGVKSGINHPLMQYLPLQQQQLVLSLFCVPSPEAPVPIYNHACVHEHIAMLVVYGCVDDPKEEY